MDQYSFLNTAHTTYFAELYDQYLINPEHVEPSWRAFFQGFEFGIEESKKEKLAFEGEEVPDNILNEKDHDLKLFFFYPVYQVTLKTFLF